MFFFCNFWPFSVVSVALAVFELFWLLLVVASVFGRFGNFQWFSVVSISLDDFLTFSIVSVIFGNF